MLTSRRSTTRSPTLPLPLPLPLSLSFLLSLNLPPSFPFSCSLSGSERVCACTDGGGPDEDQRGAGVAQ
eukprot:1910024-Rhodomonas_salina.2